MVGNCSQLRKSKRRETSSLLWSTSLLALLGLVAVTLVFGFALLTLPFGSDMGLAPDALAFFRTLLLAARPSLLLGLAT